MGSHGTEDQQGEFPGAVSEYKSYYMTPLVVVGWG